MPHSTFRLLIPTALLVLSGCSSPNWFSGRSTRHLPEYEAASPSPEYTTTTERNPRAGLELPTSAPGEAEFVGRNSLSPERTSSEQIPGSEPASQSPNLASARRACEEALRINPQDLDTRYKLAQISDDEGRFAAAERLYLGLLQDRPGDPGILTSLGWSYYLQGRYDDSERCLKESLAQQPQNRVALNNLGFVYGAKGNLDGAWECFRAAGTEAQAREALALLKQRQPVTATASLSSPPGESDLASRERHNPAPPVGGTIKLSAAELEAVRATPAATPPVKKAAEDLQRLRSENDRQQKLLLKQLQSREGTSRTISAPSPWNATPSAGASLSPQVSNRTTTAGQAEATLPAANAPSGSLNQTMPVAESSDEQRPTRVAEISTSSPAGSLPTGYETFGPELKPPEMTNSRGTSDPNHTAESTSHALSASQNSHQPNDRTGSPQLTTTAAPQATAANRETATASSKPTTAATAAAPRTISISNTLPDAQSVAAQMGLSAGPGTAAFQITDGIKKSQVRTNDAQTSPDSAAETTATGVTGKPGVPPVLKTYGVRTAATPAGVYRPLQNLAEGRRTMPTALAAPQ